MEGKRRAYKKMLQRNVAEIRVRRTEDKSWNRKINELVKESKRKLDEEFDIQLNDRFNGNKKLLERS